MRSMLIAVVVSSALAIIAETPHTPDPLTTSVTLMARVGQCSGGSFSPDGKTLAFLCDLSGVPQVWTAPTEGGWPTLVTTLDDPVNSVTWSPTSD
jgi:Tol biopolymer transport system component